MRISAISIVSVCLGLFFASELSVANTCYVSEPSALSFEKEDQATRVVVEWDGKIRRIFMVTEEGAKNAVNGLNCSSTTPYVCNLDDDGGQLGVTFEANVPKPTGQPTVKPETKRTLFSLFSKPKPAEPVVAPVKTDAMTLTMTKGELFALKDDGGELQVYVGKHEKNHVVILYKATGKLCAVTAMASQSKKTDLSKDPKKTVAPQSAVPVPAAPPAEPAKSVY